MVAELTEPEIDAGLEGFTLRGRFDYCPHTPTPKQHIALWLADRQREVFYGGAAGGGKSDWLLMAALAYVHLPGNSLILRRKTTELSKGDGLIERAHEWLDPTDARWQEIHRRWTFPSGHVLEFGHCEYDKNRFDYDGPAYQFIGFDELTSFTKRIYIYLAFSRQRRLQGDRLRLRTCSTSNPGNIGHEWVDERFQCDPAKWVDENGERLPPHERRAFVSAKVHDNPYLDADEYAESLAELPPNERAQKLEGDWSTREPGNFFDESWFDVVDRSAVPRLVREVRYWDKAATKPHPGNPDPDWTRGVRGGIDAGGDLWIVDVRGIRDKPGTVEALMIETAKVDGPDVLVRWEEEGGASGKADSHHLRRLLAPYANDIRADRVTGSKSSRATPVANHAEAGNVHVVRGPWLRDFLDEHTAFGSGIGHDDMVDGASGCYSQLTRTWGWEQLYPDAGKPSEEIAVQ